MADRAKRNENQEKVESLVRASSTAADLTGAILTTFLVPASCFVTLVPLFVQSIPSLVSVFYHLHLQWK